MKNISKILFLTLLFLAITHTGWASQLADLPAGRPITFNEIDSVISRVAQFLLVVSVLIAIIMIVWSGITYMYAGADADKVTQAQARLKSAVIGAAIVLGVGVIINTIAGIVTGNFFCQFQILGNCLIN
jgi:hypothetical protein